MKEKDTHSIFARIVKKHSNRLLSGKTSALWIDLKFVDTTKRNSLPFSEISEHQERFMKMATTGLVIYKNPDVGLARKPLDFIITSGAIAGVAILFYKPRRKKEFIVLMYDEILQAREECGRKSLTENLAKKYGKIFTI